MTSSTGVIRIPRSGDVDWENIRRAQEVQEIKTGRTPRIECSPEVEAEAERREGPFLELMGARDVRCIYSEAAPDAEDAIMREACKAAELDHGYGAGVLHGFIIESVVPVDPSEYGIGDELIRALNGETDLESEREEAFLRSFGDSEQDEVQAAITERRDEIAMLVTDHDRLQLSWRHRDRRTRRAIRAVKAVPRRRECRRNRRKVRRLEREIKRLEHLQTCQGCQVGSLGMHYQAIWERIVNELLELRSRAADPLLDRLEAIEPHPA